jgi:hypothetical protein
MRIALIFLTLALPGLIACDDSNEPVDVTAPVLEITEPVNGEFLAAGEDVHLLGTLSDDRELAEFQVDVHNNFDGHAHGRVTGTLDDPSLLKWSITERFPVPAGRMSYDIDLHDELIVPANTMAGPYHLIVSAVDKAGNATNYQDDSTVEIEVYIRNNSQSEIAITNLVEGELELEVGSPFAVEGTITDDVPAAGNYAGIREVMMKLDRPREGHDHGHNHSGRIADEALAEIDLDEADLGNYTADGALSLALISAAMNFTLSAQEADALSAEGVDHLELTIKVLDHQGNYAFEFTPVHLHLE